MIFSEKLERKIFKNQSLIIPNVPRTSPPEYQLYEMWPQKFDPFEKKLTKFSDAIKYYSDSVDKKVNKNNGNIWALRNHNKVLVVLNVLSSTYVSNKFVKALNLKYVSSALYNVHMPIILGSVSDSLVIIRIIRIILIINIIKVFL